MNIKMEKYCLSLILIIVPFMLLANSTSFEQIITQKIKHQVTKPFNIKCLPKSLIDDDELEEDFKKAFKNKFSGIKDDDIIKVIFQQNTWRISREDFTGFVSKRYMFADILVKYKEEYIIVGCVFIQNNKFLGYFFTKTFFKSILSIDKIKKENINKVCK